MVIFQQDRHDGVERKTGGIGTDHLQHFLGSVLAKCQDSRMYFGYGFYSEAVVGIPHMDGLSVEQADTDSKEIFVDIGQVRDIVGILTTRVRLYLIVCFLYHFLQLSECYFFVHRSIYFLTVL